MSPGVTIFRSCDTSWARYSLKVCACASVLILIVTAYKEEIVVPKRNIESIHHHKPDVIPDASSTIQPSFHSTVFSTRNEQQSYSFNTKDEVAFVGDVTRSTPSPVSERYLYSSSFWKHFESDYSPPFSSDSSPTSNGHSWNIELHHGPSSEVYVLHEQHKIESKLSENSTHVSPTPVYSIPGSATEQLEHGAKFEIKTKVPEKSIHIRPTSVYSIVISATEPLEHSAKFEIETKLPENSINIRPTPVFYISVSATEPLEHSAKFEIETKLPENSINIRPTPVFYISVSATEPSERSATFVKIVHKTSHKISSSFSTDEMNFLKVPSLKSLNTIQTKRKYSTKDAQKTLAIETFIEHKSVSNIQKTSLGHVMMTHLVSSLDNAQDDILKKHSIDGSVIFKDYTTSIPLDGSVIFFENSTASIPLDGPTIPFEDSTASIPLDGITLPFKDSTASIPLDGPTIPFKDSTPSIPLDGPTIPFKDSTDSIPLDGPTIPFKDSTTFISQLSRIEESKSRIFTEATSLPTVVLLTGSLPNNKETNLPSFLLKHTPDVDLIAPPAQTFHFTELKSAVFYDIIPSLVVEPDEKLKSATFKETSYNKNKPEEFPNKTSKEDNSIKSPSTELNDSKETKEPQKNVSDVFKNEHFPVKPTNVSIASTNERNKTTLKTAEPTKMSPQDFIPSIYVYIILTLGMEWPDFCAEKEFIRKEIAEAISKRGGFVEVKQIVFMKSDEHCSSVFHQEQMLSSLKNNEDQFIEVNLFLMDKKGNYDFNLTETCGALMQLEADDSENTIGNRKVYRVQVEFKTNEERDPVYPPADNPRNSSSRANIVVIIVASIASVCVVLLAILLAIMKQRLKKAGGCEPSHQEAYSLDSFPTAANVRRKKSRFSMRSFLNQAFDDPDEPSHPLNFTGLTNFTCNGQAMEDEFKSIPMNMPRMDQVPTGAEVKNRYANVIPEPKTRVPLTLIKGEPNSNYINANFVRGYGGQAKFYIACQAPLPETVPDFWRMVWEQQSKVIVMLTQWEEDGVARCAPYFSENIVDCHRVFGDFQVSLQKTDVQENYTISTLRLYNLEKNLFREITHLYYTTWPTHGVPDDVNKLLKFVLQARRYMNLDTGPVVFHCSAGTGRTGVVLALDICMREFEESRTVDLLRCVYRLRQDRGGAVQTIQQYSFVYEALSEYACRLVNQSHRPSIMPVV